MKFSHLIPFFCCSDDEEDETPAAEEENQTTGIVKQEEKEKPGQTSYELHAYSVQELQKFNKKGLLADTTLLEGKGIVLLRPFLT